MARLLDQYRTEVVAGLREQFGKDNDLAVARIEKIVLNIGVGKGPDTDKHMEEHARDLSLISGQRPVVTRARKSVAGFHLRKGDKIGLKVTLRGQRMYEFLDRLISVAIPRIRDFRGLSPDGFDRAGNFNLGLTEQTVFPEINPDKVDHVQGMDIAIVIQGGSPEESLALLRGLGMPFRREGGAGAEAG